MLFSLIRAIQGCGPGAPEGITHSQVCPVLPASLQDAPRAAPRGKTPRFHPSVDSQEMLSSAGLCRIKLLSALERFSPGLRGPEGIFSGVTAQALMWDVLWAPPGVAAPGFGFAQGNSGLGCQGAQGLDSLPHWFVSPALKSKGTLYSNSLKSLLDRLKLDFRDFFLGFFVGY